MKINKHLSSRATYQSNPKFTFHPIIYINEEGSEEEVESKAKQNEHRIIHEFRTFVNRSNTISLIEYAKIQFSASFSQ